jgi:hypothetical protein
MDYGSFPAYARNWFSHYHTFTTIIPYSLVQPLSEKWKVHILSSVNQVKNNLNGSTNIHLTND